MHNRLLGLLTAVVLLSPVAALARTWTDVQGRTTEAAFVRVADSQVVLQRGNQVLRIPFNQLSAPDQQFVRDKLKARKQEHLLPLETPAAASPPAASAQPAEKTAPAESDEPQRTWTDSRGRTIEARMIEPAADKVVLDKAGKQITVPLDKLSDADRIYVLRRLAAQTPKVAATPPTAAASGDGRETPPPLIPRSPPLADRPSFVPPPAVAPPTPTVPRSNVLAGARLWNLPGGRALLAKVGDVVDGKVTFVSENETVSVAYDDLGKFDQGRVMNELIRSGQWDRVVRKEPPAVAAAPHESVPTPFNNPQHARNPAQPPRESAASPAGPLVMEYTYQCKKCWQTMRTQSSVPPTKCSKCGVFWAKIVDESGKTIHTNHLSAKEWGLGLAGLLVLAVLSAVVHRVVKAAWSAVAK